MIYGRKCAVVLYPGSAAGAAVHMNCRNRKTDCTNYADYSN